MKLDEKNLKVVNEKINSGTFTIDDLNKFKGSDRDKVLNLYHNWLNSFRKKRK